MFSQPQRVNKEEVKHKEITIGGITVPVYMMLDGEYRWSMRQASIAVGYGDSWLRDTIRAGSQSLTKLKNYGFAGEIIEVPSGGAIDTYLISTQDFMAMVMYAAIIGERKQAVALMAAAMQETFERRADHIFGVIRDEDEYIQKFEYRYASILLNISLRTTIGEWIKEQSESELKAYTKKYSIKCGARGIYWSALGEIYQVIFGKYKKDINGFLDIPKSYTPKDHVHVTQLQRIVQIEDLAAKYIKRKNMNPIEAIKAAAEALMIEIEDPKLGDRVSRKDVYLVLNNKKNG